MKTLLVVLSEKCNLNCTYCGVDKWSKKAIDPDLYLAEFRKLRAEFPNELIKIEFFGGEPLLQLELVDVIINGVRDDSNVKFFMPTNGLLLTEENINYLLDNRVEISLSFDGLWQDKNRLQLNGKKTLDRFFEKKTLFDKIPNILCHTMITRGCYNLLENHLFIRNNFGFNPELTLVRDVGTWDMASVEKLKKGIDELFDWYLENPQEDIPHFILFYLRHILDYKSKSVTTDNCGAGLDVLMFSENKIVPCTRFKDQPDIIARIPEFRKMTACSTCEVRNYCKKGCLYEQIQNDGPIEELCIIYKYMYNKVFSLIKEMKDNEKFVNIIKKEIHYE